MDWDFPVLISGPEGSGKSAFALNLACDLDDDVEENIEKHCFWYVSEDVMKFKRMVSTIPPSVIVIDEAGADMNNREAMVGTNRELVKLFIIARQFNHVVFLVIPDGQDLDVYFRKRRVAAKIIVEWLGDEMERERGLAVFHKREKSRYQTTPFWRNFLQIRFPDMPDSFRDKYKHLKHINTLARMGVSDEEEILQCELTTEEDIVLRAVNSGLTHSQIAPLVNMSRRNVGNVLKRARDKVGEVN